MWTIAGTIIVALVIIAAIPFILWAIVLLIVHIVDRFHKPPINPIIPRHLIFDGQVKPKEEPPATPIGPVHASSNR